jgi:sucrose synthase
MFSYFVMKLDLFFFVPAQVTRLLPDATGTTCGQRLEKVLGTEHTHILRVPFRTENGIVRKWISRFEVWPYLETFTDVDT